MKKLFLLLFVLNALVLCDGYNMEKSEPISIPTERGDSPVLEDFMHLSLNSESDEEEAVDPEIVKVRLVEICSDFKDCLKPILKAMRFYYDKKLSYNRSKNTIKTILHPYGKKDSIDRVKDIYKPLSDVQEKFRILCTTENINERIEAVSRDTSYPWANKFTALNKKITEEKLVEKKGGNVFAKWQYSVPTGTKAPQDIVMKTLYRILLQTRALEKTCRGERDDNVVIFE